MGLRGYTPDLTQKPIKELSHKPIPSYDLLLPPYETNSIAILVENIIGGIPP